MKIKKRSLKLFLNFFNLYGISFVLHRSKTQAEPTKRYVEWAKQKLKANARNSYTN